MRLFRRSSFSAWPARTRPPIIRHSVDSVNDVQRRSSCPEITAHGLAILRAVDEFRFEGRSTKGGRETADAICVALRLISLSLSLSLSLSRTLFLAITDTRILNSKFSFLPSHSYRGVHRYL